MFLLLRLSILSLLLSWLMPEKTTTIGKNPIHTSGEAQIDMPCDNSNPNTENNVINNNIECAGVPIVTNSCRMQDSLVLVTLYNSTNGANWTNRWNLNQPMNSWYGVTLNSEGCVEQLSLWKNNLIGNIPPELGQLFNLKDLSLYENQLSGTIPTELAQLTNLITLVLYSNQLSGTIPTELAQLTNLENLFLFDNQLSGTIPTELAQLTNLRILSLFENQLSGTIPPELGQLTNLIALGLYNNELSGEIPIELTQLTNLEALSLFGNELSGTIPPELAQLTELTYLSVGNNQLSGSIPPELGKLSKLKELYLYNNELDGEIPIELGQLTNLDSLLLLGNQLSGEIPPELGQLTNLKILSLFENQLSGTIPPELGQLTNLIALGLHDNQLSGEIPAELGQLTNLTALGLNDNQLSGQIPAELGQLTKLTFFYLNNNQLSGCIPTELNQLCYLTNTSVTGYCNSTPECQYDFTNNPALSWGGDFLRFCNGESQIGAPCNDGNPNTENDAINNNCECAGTPIISNPCRMQDSLVLVTLYNSTNGANWTNRWNLNQPMGSWFGVTLNAEGCVTELDLQTNQLSGTIPSELGQLTNLIHLVLNQNQLGGAIPPVLGQLTNLTWLGLWANQLSGTIPSELGQLTNLTQLDLEQNQLRGTIPPELGQLRELERFWLSNNQLSGSIPAEFGQLTNLTHFFLFDNNLSGCFPEELAVHCRLDFNLDSGSNIGGYNFTNNPLLPWQGNFEPFCNGEAQIGAPCNDGNPNTENDAINNNCECAGTLIVSNPCRMQDSLVLVMLYNSTNGINWTNRWNLNEPMGSWFGVTLNAEGCVAEIDLTDNRLSGGIPAELGQLTNLTLLDLSYNQLSGNIPPELGQLANLQNLFIHTNQLSGSIPAELGQLSNLGVLWLGNNRLIGCLPEELRTHCNINYTLSNNPALPWRGDFVRFCNGEAQTGAPCDDGNPNTENDVINEACECAGILNCTFESRIAASTNATCGQNNGSFTIAVDGGTSPYTYDIGNGATNNPNFSNLEAGAYTISISDAVGCTNTVTATINEITNLNITASSTDVDCGEANGTASVNIISGAPPFTYDIGNGVTTSPEFTDLAVGTYIITVTDNNDCVVEAGINISGNPVGLNATIGQVLNASCGQATGGFTIVVSNGQSPYTFELDDIINTTPIFTNLAGGSYELTIIDATGCSTFLPVTIEDENSTITATSSNTQMASCGTANGSFTIAVDGGISPYTYDIGNGITSDNTFTNLSAGEYTITITDATGCTSTTTTSISAAALPTANISGATTVCPNEQTLLTASGGVSYEWSNFATSNRVNVGVGTYTVTATDENGCTAEASVTVTELVSPSASIEGDLTICAGESTTLTASGGVSYAWNNFAQSNRVEVGVGRYEVTVTGTNGCTDITSVEVTEVELPTIDLVNKECSEDRNTYGFEILTEADNQLSVNIGEVLGNNGNFSINVPADTPVIVTVRNAQEGCETSQTIQAPDCSCPAPQSMGDIAICEGETITALSVSSGGVNNASEIRWYDVPTAGTVIATGFSFTPTQAGTFFAEIYNLTTNCQSPRTAISLAINSLPTAAISGATQVCADETTSISASLADSYLWSTGETTQSIDVAAGTHSVTITDINGCDAQAAITINQLQEVQVEISGQTMLCADEQTTLTASGGVSYQWSNFASSNQVNVGIGSYTVTATDANGCEGIATINIENNAELETSITAISNASCGEANGSFAVNVSTGSAPFSYNIGDGATNNPNFSNLEAGTYTVTVTDSNGCEDTVTITIENNAELETSITAISHASCGTANGSFTIAVDGGISPYTYDIGNGITSDNTFTNLSAGEYTITITDATGCTSTTTTSISAAALPTANISGATTVCPNEQTLLTASGGVSYEWSNFATSNRVNVGVGTYTVTATDENGCTAEASVTVTELVSPSASIEGDLTICAGESTTLTASGGVSYLWSTGETTQSIDVAAGTYTVTVTDANACEGIDSITIVEQAAIEEQEIEVQICEGETYLLGNEEISEPGMYTVTLSTAEGCDSTITLFLEQTTSETIEIQNDTIHLAISEGVNSISLDIIASPRILEYPYYGELTIKSDNSIEYQLLAEHSNYIGLDSFIYEVCDTKCIKKCDMATIYIDISKDCGVAGSDIPLRWGIAPNGNGKDEIFDPLGDISNDCAEHPSRGDAELIIINKWGEIVYQTIEKGDQQYKGWEGRDNDGKRLPDEVYFFLLKFTINGEVQKPIKGSVTLFSIAE